MKPPYLILHKQSRILNTPNSVARVFDDIGSKCKMMYHFKISAEAGIQDDLGKMKSSLDNFGLISKLGKV
jgi:hypothetical protein